MAMADKERKAEKYDVLVTVLGGAGVGKSASVVQFVNSHFVEKYLPTLEDEFSVQKIVAGKMRSIGLLDTAGTENFGHYRDAYYKQGTCFLFVVDLTQHNTLVELDEYLAQLELCRPAGPTRDASVFLTLGGNKLDLVQEDPSRRQVTLDELQAKARELEARGFKGVRVFEYSAKSRENLVPMFEDLLERGLTKAPVKARRGLCALL